MYLLAFLRQIAFFPAAGRNRISERAIVEKYDKYWKLEKQKKKLISRVERFFSSLNKHANPLDIFQGIASAMHFFFSLSLLHIFAAVQIYFEKSIVYFDLYTKGGFEQYAI